MRLHESGERQPVVVTTSWDDGVPSDIRLAERLAERGMAGTFYIADDGWAGRRITPEGLHALHAMGMEIGGHTVTHPDLTKLPSNVASREIQENRENLQDLLGEQLRTFCYPFGRFNRRTARLVAEAGYSLGRTNINHQIHRSRNAFRQSVTWQLYPHKPSSYIRHGVKYLNINGTLRYLQWKARGGELSALERSVERLPPGAVVHLWGHSWEIAELNLWSTLEEVLERLAALPNTRFANNFEAYVGCRR